jgi:hypothetical protein
MAGDFGGVCYMNEFDLNFLESAGGKQACEGGCNELFGLFFFKKKKTSYTSWEVVRIN